MSRKRGFRLARDPTSNHAERHEVSAAKPYPVPRLESGFFLGLKSNEFDNLPCVRGMVSSGVFQKQSSAPAPDGNRPAFGLGLG